MGGQKSTFIRNKNCGWGTLRSLVKVSVFLFFILGIQSNPIPLGNIVLIIVSFFGYYSLKISYDVDKPYELIESLLRFGLLGFYFIPWVIMYGVFQSMLLAFIAMAFFAIPPIPKDRKSSELFAMYDFYDKIIFGIIMVIVLVLFLTGWDVSIGSTLGTTFLYFWFVTGIAGFFSPADARPAMGFIMLGGATIIYGIGPGTQEVMSGLFGPWWPTIQNTFESMTEPIGEAFGGLTNTMRSGWLLLTNPVGYATQLMNGTHAVNPVGKTGALGIEIKDVSISPIFPDQPFTITAQITNEGADDANNVLMYISSGYEPPKAVGPSKWLGPAVPIAHWIKYGFHEKEALKIAEMFGYNTTEGMKNLIRCYNSDVGFDPTLASAECKNKMIRQDTWQIVFMSNGVSCETIEKFKLREKSIPIKVSVVYNYSTNSEVDVEFISKEEWSRLAQANELNQKLRFITSTYSTAPVEFPVGTPGLKNPILVDQEFHLGLNIQSSSTKGIILGIEHIILDYPEEFELKGDCTPDARDGVTVGTAPKGYKRLVWEFSQGGSRVIFCPFKALEQPSDSKKKLTGPTKTYVVKASATYTYSKWREKSTKIEFGGKCCGDDDCISGQVCNTKDGICVPKDSKEAIGYICKEDCIEPSAENLNKLIVESTAGNKTLTQSLLSALMTQESGRQHCSGNKVKTSPVGATGIMQVMPSTAEGMGYTGTDICKYETNIRAGVKYLDKIDTDLSKYKSNKDYVRFYLAAYNCGIACVKERITKHGEDWKKVEPTLPSQTINYVSSICAACSGCC